MEIYFENHGQGQVVPTCLWEFLAKHTNIDAINKRNEKGFVFTIGDSAPIRTTYIGETMEAVIGDKLETGTTRETLLRSVKEKFHVFHIVVDRRTGFSMPDLAGHIMAISPGDIAMIPEMIISTIQLQKGMELEQIMEQWDEVNQPTIRNAIGQLNLSDDEEEITF